MLEVPCCWKADRPNSALTCLPSCTHHSQFGQQDMPLKRFWCDVFRPDCLWTKSAFVLQRMLCTVCSYSPSRKELQSSF